MTLSKLILMYLLLMTHTVCTGAQAKKSDISVTSYDNEIAAVVAAVNAYNPTSISEDREYIGAILEENQRYYYSVSAGKVGHNKINAKIRFPKSMRLVALWHTHAGFGPNRRNFSKVDTRQAKKLNKPFYMANYTGELKVFTPGDKINFKGQARGKVILSNILAKAQAKPVKINTTLTLQASTAP